MTTILDDTIDSSTELASSSRSPRQFEAEKTEETTTSKSNSFIEYFERLKVIYELDLKILGQLADLLSGVDQEVLPALMKSLEPILPALISQTNNIDLAQIIGYVTQTLQRSTFHASLSSHLGDLDFINISKDNRILYR